MGLERSSELPQPDLAPMRVLGWQASFLVGLASVVLGLVVAFRPTASLIAIAVLLGILMILSGVFHIVDAVGGPEEGRVWRGIAGVVFFVAGIALIRHLHLSLALIGLFIGATWVIQGILALSEGISARGRTGRWWQVLFGVISLAAGIVVISTPVASVAALATLMGIWFAILGVFEMVGALASRRARRTAVTGPVNVPGQRASDSAATGSVPGGSPAAGRKVQG
jgi:uncharacterized membrane protein HdeD (DUF308 family)